MEVRDLRVLLACLDLGSMTRAATRLHLVQPAVSQAVARLERESGVALLERHRGGVRATEAGRVLAVHARQVLAALDRAGEEMEAFRGLHTGTVRIGLLHTVTPLVLVRLLRAARGRHPGIRIRVEEDSVGRLVDGLLTADLDLAVVFLPAGDPRPATVPQGLRVTELRPAPLAVASAPDDAAVGHQATVALTALRTAPWVTFPPGNPGRRWLDHCCAGAGFEPQIAAEVGTFAQLRGFVAAGIGLAVVPGAAVAPQRAAGTLRVTAVTPPAQARLGYLHRTSTPGRAAAAVRALIDAEFGRSGPAADVPAAAPPGSAPY